jgi:hypothetical protein
MRSSGPNYRNGRCCKPEGICGSVANRLWLVLQSKVHLAHFGGLIWPTLSH